MGAAAVLMKEIDLTTRVASFAGVYGAIVIAAKKGQTNKPSLVTSDTQFLNRYTPDSKIKVGYDMAHFSAMAYLERSNKLWVKRVTNNALYGGMVVRTSTSASANMALSSGLSDPSSYIFDSLPEIPGVSESGQFTVVADVGGSLNNTFFYASTKTTDYAFYYNVDSGGVAPTLLGKTLVEIAITTGASASVVASATALAMSAVTGGFIATSNLSTVNYQMVVAGNVTNISDGSAPTGFSFPSPTIQGVDEVRAQDEALLLYGANQGAWSNQIHIKIRTIAESPELVEPGSFEISVFKTENLNVALEKHLISRTKGQKDGRGRNIFVEDVLEGSNYIRAISNPLIPESTLPKVQSTALALSGGSDGVAITDANMISAVDQFKNTSEFPVTILMDGGYAVPSYQLALDSIAQYRQDCVAVLSVPYASEVHADYLNEIINYRKTALNLNSSYSALYTPHLQIQDKFNDRKLWISPDGHVAGSISFSANNYEIWFPPAGYKRGALNVLDTVQRFQDGELDALYDAGVNPIKFKSGKGIVVWGQKTLLARASALDRLNVRLMLIVITPAIKDLLENWLFELNNEEERAIIEIKIKDYLETIKSRKGLYDYDVVCDDTNNLPEDIDANRLNVDVFVKPTKSIESVPVRIVITPSNISFSTAAGAI